MRLVYSGDPQYTCPAASGDPPGSGGSYPCIVEATAAEVYSLLYSKLNGTPYAWRIPHQGPDGQWYASDGALINLASADGKVAFEPNAVLMFMQGLSAADVYGSNNNLEQVAINTGWTPSSPPPPPPPTSTPPSAPSSPSSPPTSKPPGIPSTPFNPLPPSGIPVTKTSGPPIVSKPDPVVAAPAAPQKDLAKNIIGGLLLAVLIKQLIS